MLSGILEWLRDHLGPSDAGLDKLLSVSAAEDGWMLIDVAGQDQDVAALLRDYLVVPDFGRRGSEPGPGAVAKASLTNARSRGERMEEVPRPLVSCHPRSRHLQSALREFKSFSRTGRYPRFVTQAAGTPEVYHYERSFHNASEKIKRRCDGASLVRHSSAVPPTKQKPKLCKRFFPAENESGRPTHGSQNSLDKGELSPNTTPAKRNKLAKFFIDDVNVPQDRETGFPCAFGVLEDVKNVAVSGADVRSPIDAIFGAREWARGVAVHVDRSTTVWLVIAGQAREVENIEGADRALILRKPFLPSDGILKSGKPMLALEWKNDEEFESTAVLGHKLYSAVMEKTKSLCQDALDLLQSDPMSLSFRLPLGIRIEPCRLLAPMVTLQVLWTHITDVISKLYPEQEHQVKPSTRRRALARSGRNKALARCMKDLAVATKKGQRRLVNKRSLERAHGAMIKSRGENSNRKRALASGKYCMTGRRGHWTGIDLSLVCDLTLCSIKLQLTEIWISSLCDKVSAQEKLWQLWTYILRES